MMNNYQAVRLPKTACPLPETAVHQYERSGGKLNNFGEFGTDHLLRYVYTLRLIMYDLYYGVLK